MRCVVVPLLLVVAACSNDETSAAPPTGNGGAGGDVAAGGNGGSAGSTGANMGGGGSGGDPGPDCSIGAPLNVPDDTWTTVMSPGTACGNAGQAGFVVNPSASSANLLVYFMGGGACFNQGDCGASLLNGFTEQEGVNLAQGRPLFDRTDSANPFADWDYVFVPYCNGDFHSGGNVASYGTNHVGHTNMDEHLKRIVPTFCDADRVVVTGTSAGGFGSTFAFIQIHEHFGDSVPFDLISDSGPYMTPQYMPTAAQDMIDTNWGFRANMPADCSQCPTGWDALYPYISQRWPTDRMSFISYTRDPSIQGRFNPYTPLDDLDAFEAGVNALADEVLVPLPNFHIFFLGGQGHVLLNGASPLDQTQSGITLGTFIQRQLDDDALWADVRP